MKLLFSASDPDQVELVRTRLQAAGILSEIRQEEADAEGIPGYPELWVAEGADYRYASIIFCSPGHLAL
jgi:hypothetical protein